jgi:ribosomal protein S18 acetylase RimI-like enzyme
MESQIIIRKAGKEDSTIVAALASATFFEAYVESDDPRTLAEYVHDSFSVDRVAVEINDPKNTFFLAEYDDRPVGFAKMRRGEKPPFLSGENCVEIHRIYLFSKFGRKGIGSALMEACYDRAGAEGFDSIFLGVWDKNEPGKRFYEKHGFTVVGETDFPYGDEVFVTEVMFRRL